jgi:hypothetical protein
MERARGSTLIDASRRRCSTLATMLHALFTSDGSSRNFLLLLEKLDVFLR